MKEINPIPICLTCGNPMELVKKDNRYFYSCHSCSFGNKFQTIKSMVCPTCFSGLMVVQERYVRVTLCSNPACHSYREGERGRYSFRTIRHKDFKNYLDWNVNRNYFRFDSMVNIKFHNHLVGIANRIIEAQGWNWPEKPELRTLI